MIEEKALIQNFITKKKERLKKPDWLKIKIGDPTNQNAVLQLDRGAKPPHRLPGSALPEYF